MEILRCQTDPSWARVALGDLQRVMVDHAHCEKKAAATAMALVSSYPEDSELVRRCTKLAQEELRHFQQVFAILRARGWALDRDRGDPYARQLKRLVRTDPSGRRTDRLLVAALIEARSCERLRILASSIDDPELARFYDGLATAEAGHFRLFCDLALRNDLSAAERLDELAVIEATIVQALPIEPRMH